MSEDRSEAIERTLSKAYSDITRDIAVSRNFTEEGVKLLVSQKITMDAHAQILRDQDARLDRIETMLTQILMQLRGTLSAYPPKPEPADPVEIEAMQPGSAPQRRERTFWERGLGIFPEETEPEKH